MMVTLIVQPIYPWAKKVRYLLNGRQVSLKAAVEKNLVHSQELETRIFHPVT